MTEPKFIHTNKLDYKNKCVQQVLEKFSNIESLKLYNYLRMFYWTSCENLIDFENQIKEKLDRIQSIDELLIIE